MGGLDPTRSSYAASTFDLERGRPVALDELLVSDGAALSALADEILGRLDRSVLFEETDTRTVAGIVSRSEVWVLDGKGATILFPRYSVAPYAAGDLEVRLSWKELRPWLRPDAPLLIVR